MQYTRRDFGKLALAALPAAAVFERVGLIAGTLAQAKPNSLIGSVQIGVITYSYRSMPDQTAEATLRYVVDSGISAIELMGGPVESFAGIPSGGGGGGRGRGAATPEQIAAQQEQARKVREWRASVSMEPFKRLRKMYNDAGVTIYAWKQLSPNMSDEEFEYIFTVAEALGCTHTTLELPTDPAQLKRIGDFALKKKIYAAYHTHTQGSMTAFDQAFALSPGNMANVDFGHYVAAGNIGGTCLQFLQKFHDRIASFHLKDRTTPERGAQNLPWGSGETPIREILQTLRKNNWKIPATIELEYRIPEGSDAVKEVRACLDYCRGVLTTRE